MTAPGLGATACEGTTTQEDRDASNVRAAARPSVLFPDADERHAISSWLTDILAESRHAVRHGPVAPALSGHEIESLFSTIDFAAPSGIRQSLAWAIAGLTGGIVHVDHPRYFGLFNPTPSFPAECAERIAAAFNPQLATATTSPFAVALESHVLKALASRAGLPATTVGHFTGGGSEANATAMICALTHRQPSYATAGVRAYTGKPLLYTSEGAHLAWVKIAHQTGIGRDAVRLVATDGKGRMDPGALEATMRSDAADGAVPVMVASTAGTTGAGMIDPLHACGQIARQFGAWHHVDAAWGGALIVSDRLRHLLRGIETADSITIDAHKWLATTMGCGMIFTAHPAVLSAAFNVVMDCMPSNHVDRDPYVTTMQWSRRFLGLRLFLGLAAAGWDGYAAHVERAIDLAALLENKLVRRAWTRVNDSPMAVLCVRPPAGARDARHIAEATVASGIAWVSAVTFEGESVVRLCLTSGETQESDISRLVDILQASACP